jgi:carboxypeptidase C (cathepsin A)
LGFASDLPYEIISRTANTSWSFKEFEGQNVNVADKLAAAMRANPYLRVYVGCGYHDGATPYFAAQHTVAHLAVPEELRQNVQFAYYHAGHMMYVHEESRIAQSAHLASFVEPVG